jgi:D-glycero-alpha-D-manno-heptose-7-phosphate kinase
MLYTGKTRLADEVLKEQSANTETDQERRCALRKMTRMAQELRESLCRDDLDSFGEVLHQGWLLKRSLASKISDDRIDEWYERARRHGAIGGKLLGAGGGGCLLLYACPERHREILACLPELRPVPIQFEPQGSKIVYIERV